MEKQKGKMATASEAIEALLKEIGLNAPTFAKEIGLNYQRVYDIQSGPCKEDQRGGRTPYKRKVPAREPELPFHL